MYCRHARCERGLRGRVISGGMGCKERGRAYIALHGRREWRCWDYARV